MAKESMKARERKRRALEQKYRTRRAEAKEKAKYGDDLDLQKLPRNSSRIRQRNRSSLDGRPRGFMRNFNISRNLFREMANMGLIPGVTKSS